MSIFIIIALTINNNYNIKLTYKKLDLERQLYGFTGYFFKCPLLSYMVIQAGKLLIEMQTWLYVVQKYDLVH